jgi:CubicO group peptidase (beta-lactamase class C family)
MRYGKKPSRHFLDCGCLQPERDLSSSTIECVTVSPPQPPALDPAVREVVTARLHSVQRDARVPSVTAAVGRDGRVVWRGSVGFADVVGGIAASADVQYRIGSITKTFTAALTLLLASEGCVDLDADVEEYLPGTPVGRARLRELLAHRGGVQREAATDMWASMCGPGEAELHDSLAACRMVAAPGERWHYSNLGYAVLGLAIRHVTGRSCPELIEERLWRPLRLTRTTWRAEAPFAIGYRVDPYDDLVHPEPDMDQGAVGVGGQAWSTTARTGPGDAARSGSRPALHGTAPPPTPGGSCSPPRATAPRSPASTARSSPSCPATTSPPPANLTQQDPSGRP